MFSKVIHICLGMALFSAGLSAKSDQLAIEGYSTEPLTAPIFDPAEVAVRTAKFNNWLNGNADKLTDQKKTQMREHLYYLINSHIKHRQADNKALFPGSKDLILSMLFSWSDPLGVYGGSLVHNKMKMDGWEEQVPLNILPEDWSLSLNDGLFNLASKQDGWNISYPYYFMLADIQNFKNAAGQKTGILSISTGSARHTDSSSFSQATLMFLTSPDRTPKEFTDYWKQAFALPEKASNEVGIGQHSNSFYVFDEASRLHKELVTWTTPQGSFAVAYAGIDGTYQHNRQHFLDFLAAVQTED